MDNATDRRTLRNSDFFFISIGVGMLALCMTFGHMYVRRIADRDATIFNRGIVERYGLTDLCLFTEARYARHPSQSDFNAPFQDHPSSLEHFPAGGMAGIPSILRKAQ